MHIDQSSLEGNSEWINDVLHRQLHFCSKEEKRALAQKMVLPIVGDELTTSRIQTLKRYCAKDDNGLACMEYAAEVPGFFHVFITCGIMVFQTHCGSKHGRGLNQDITLLQRLRAKGGREGKGKEAGQSNRVDEKPAASKSLRSLKGPSWHKLKEVIEHTLEARALLHWVKKAGCGPLEGLQEWRPLPEELVKAAEEIISEWASEGPSGDALDSEEEDEKPKRGRPRKKPVGLPQRAPKSVQEKNDAIRQRNERLVM
ncbi:hypothetical protein FRC04_007118 [Tulasnella sp. 424]|nr:hypothetical protein FRC04_007118 [Tulasnella sp. 424]KAG8960074.1 hypothetical protein FRC05_007125 [Tulasnella sp. 425]